MLWLVALHGYEWIPAAWYIELENGEEDGWDCIIQIAMQVAAFSSQVPHPLPQGTP